jgi:predicted TIM-barrel fold metal-dependent hydrolase
MTARNVKGGHPVATKAKPCVVAIEEHYWDPEVAAQFSPGESMRPGPLRQRLDDLGALRLKEMDEAGIDMQVLSHGAPATQRFDPETAVRLARKANDRLHEVVRAHPNRFAAFATLPTPDPVAAADEFERAVSKLGFVGAMVHGLTNGVFLDDRRFWPIFERAQALDVPLYLHPAAPHPAVVDAYYQHYVSDFPNLLSAAWGYTIETATQGLRMVLSGVFDAYPRLKIILGHLGEGLPFLLWRIDNALSRPGNRKIDFRETFRAHFHITTSGNFSDSALLCSILELGVDRILFAVDWPFVTNPPAIEWIARVPLATEDVEKILYGNAKRLLRLS